MFVRMVRQTAMTGWAMVVIVCACRFSGQAGEGGPSNADRTTFPGHGVVSTTGAAMKSFDDLLESRRSIRRFRPDPVPKSMLDAIVSAAISGPSAGNLQAFRVVVVQDAASRMRLRNAALGQEWVGMAPVVLVFCADGPASARKYGARGESLYAVQDATIACTLAWLKAVDLGLSGVWVGAFDEAQVAQILDLPRGVRPVAILPIGYPDETPTPRPSRPRGDLVIER